MAHHRVGDAVQTPFGKGRVVERRNAGRVLVNVEGRLVSMSESGLTHIQETRRSRAAGGSKQRDIDAAAPTSLDTAPAVTAGRSQEIDLHGLTVEQALTRLDQTLNDALLAGVTTLRIIHGRSGGRIRHAVHARLREVGAVRSYRLDPGNAGLTVVEL